MILDDIRKQLDTTDNEIAKLFFHRMQLVNQVAAYKKEHSRPVLNTVREREIINRLTSGCTEERAEQIKLLYTTIFDISRSEQESILCPKSQTAESILLSAMETIRSFPNSATVACQGIEGANSSAACKKMFSRPDIMYFLNFDSVFAAVDKGMCRYGILPIENSLQGSVLEVYDLMRKYRFNIVKSIKVNINHFLLSKHDSNISEIEEIYSHPQAIAQCSSFLKSLPSVKRIIPCENTAVAAKLVADSQSDKIAAISSVECASLYNLAVLSESIQNNDNNYTRFICISREIEIYPGADKISMMLSLAHKPNSLYEVVSSFASRGLNLTKIESRPIPGTDFEFIFYIDIDGNVFSKDIISLINTLEHKLGYFCFLGNYSEL